MDIATSLKKGTRRAYFPSPSWKYQFLCRVIAKDVGIKRANAGKHGRKNSNGTAARVARGEQTQRVGDYDLLNAV